MHEIRRRYRRGIAVTRKNMILRDRVCGARVDFPHGEMYVPYNRPGSKFAPNVRNIGLFSERDRRPKYTQKLAQETEEERREALLAALKEGSVVIWHHLNLHGEYDFSEEMLQDSVGFDWLGHANVSTTRSYDKRQSRPEERPTFRVEYDS